jgi:hypothetical protein
LIDTGVGRVRINHAACFLFCRRLLSICAACFPFRIRTSHALKLSICAATLGLGYWQCGAISWLLAYVGVGSILIGPWPMDMTRNLDEKLSCDGLAIDRMMGFIFHLPVASQ